MAVGTRHVMPFDGATQTLVNPTNATYTGDAVDGFENAETFIWQLDVSGKSLSTGTIDIYIQTLLPGGAWTDLHHLSQITVATIGNGNFYGKVSIANATNIAASTAVQDAALGAAAVATGSPMTDTLRVKTVVSTLTGGDTITLVLTVQASKSA